MTTYRSKIYLCAFLLFSLICAIALNVQAQEPANASAVTPAAPSDSTERLKLAAEYLKIIPVEQDIMKAVNQISERVPADQRVLFRSLAEKNIDYNKLRTAAQAVLADMFTAAELKALTAFYSTPEGQSVRVKMADYDQKMMPVMQEVMLGFAKRVQESGITVAPQ